MTHQQVTLFGVSCINMAPSLLATAYNSLRLGNVLLLLRLLFILHYMMVGLRVQEHAPGYAINDYPCVREHLLHRLQGKEINSLFPKVSCSIQ